MSPLLAVAHAGCRHRPTAGAHQLKCGCCRVQLAGALPEGTQGHFRSILTDEHLRVMGSEGTIYAMGDGATIFQVSTGWCKCSAITLLSTYEAREARVSWAAGLS